MATPQKITLQLTDCREVLSGNIDEVIGQLQKLKAEFEGKGFSNLEIDVDTYYEYGETYVKAALEGSRMETPDEAGQRERMDKHKADIAEAYARRQYEALRAKFG